MVAQKTNRLFKAQSRRPYIPIFHKFFILFSFRCRKFYEKLKQTHNDHQTISIWWCPLYILLWLIVFLVVLFTYNILPTPILEADEVKAGKSSPIRKHFLHQKFFKIIAESIPQFVYRRTSSEK